MCWASQQLAHVHVERCRRRHEHQGIKEVCVPTAGIGSDKTACFIKLSCPRVVVLHLRQNMSEASVTSDHPENVMSRVSYVQMHFGGTSRPGIVQACLHQHLSYAQPPKCGMYSHIREVRVLSSSTLAHPQFAELKLVG